MKGVTLPKKKKKKKKKPFNQPFLSVGMFRFTFLFTKSVLKSIIDLTHNSACWDSSIRRTYGPFSAYKT